MGFDIIDILQNESDIYKKLYVSHKMSRDTAMAESIGRAVLAAIRQFDTASATSPAAEPVDVDGVAGPGGLREFH